MTSIFPIFISLVAAFQYFQLDNRHHQPLLERSASQNSPPLKVSLSLVHISRLHLVLILTSAIPVATLGYFGSPCVIRAARGVPWWCYFVFLTVQWNIFKLSLFPDPWCSFPVSPCYTNRLFSCPFVFSVSIFLAMLHQSSYFLFIYLRYVNFPLHFILSFLFPLYLSLVPQFCSVLHPTSFFFPT